MSRIVFVTWNGGGNLVPALGIARELDRRGHPIAFLGQETQRRAVEDEHLPFTAYAPGPQRDSRPATAAERQRLLMRDTWLNTSLADDVAALLAREPADGLVIDCMLAGVLARSREFGAPAAVLVPGLFQSVLPMRDAMLAIGNQLRPAQGCRPWTLRR